MKKELKAVSMDKLKAVTGGAVPFSAVASTVAIRDLAAYTRLQQIIKVSGLIGHW